MDVTSFLHYKRQLNTMLVCIRIFTNNCEVNMQVKRFKGKTLSIIDEQPIYYEKMCLCWVSPLLGMFYLNSKCYKLALIPYDVSPAWKKIFNFHSFVTFNGFQVFCIFILTINESKMLILTTNTIPF